MKLLVLGATGATGKLFVSQALDAGHQVTAYVRDPAKVTQRQPNLAVVSGRVDDADALASALAGQDAVVSMLGNGMGKTDKTLIEDSTHALIRAAQDSGVERVVIMSALGVAESFAKGSTVGKFVYKRFMAGVFADKARGETELKSSRLDWTLAYPATLNNKPLSNNVTATLLEDTPKLTGMPNITRADVSAWLLKTVTTGSFARQTVVLRAAK
jgi:putative NADH-flavin reductase